MSIIAEFSVSSPEIALYDATTSVPSTTLELTAQIGTDPSRPVLFFWAEGPDLEAFDEALATDRTITDVEMYTDLDERRLYRAQLSDEVELVSYPVWVEAGASQLETTCQRGIWRMRMRFPDRDSFTEIRRWCHDNDLNFSLYSLYTEDGRGRNRTGLNSEQVRTLRTAYEAGHYQIPQAATAAEVADMLGISQQALSERLRRAYTALIEAHVLEDE